MLQSKTFSGQNPFLVKLFFRSKFVSGQKEIPVNISGGRAYAHLHFFIFKPHFHILHLPLTVIASVELGKPWTQARLDQLEGKLQKNLMTMDYNGGMNLRDETKRRRGT